MKTITKIIYLLAFGLLGGLHICWNSISETEVRDLEELAQIIEIGSAQTEELEQKKYRATLENIQKKPQHKPLYDQMALEFEETKVFVKELEIYRDALAGKAATNQTFTQSYFVEQGKGKEIQKLVKATREAFIEVVDEVAEMEIKGVKILPQDLESVRKGLLLEELPKDWHKEYWAGRTVQEALVLLDVLEQNARNSSAQITNFLSSQMGRKCLCNDKFDVFSSSSKPAVRLGETYKTEIALADYSSQADFSVSVDGKATAVVDGKASYRSKQASRVGEHSYKAEITIANPITGAKQKVEKTFYYEVVK